MELSSVAFCWKLFYLYIFIRYVHKICSDELQIQNFYKPDHSIFLNFDILASPVGALRGPTIVGEVPP